MKIRSDRQILIPCLSVAYGIPFSDWLRLSWMCNRDPNRDQNRDHYSIGVKHLVDVVSFRWLFFASGLCGTLLWDTFIKKSYDACLSAIIHRGPKNVNGRQ